MDIIKIAEKREMIISKANYLVQNGRFKLSLPEQKVILYIISMIKPNSTQLEYTFNIREYCKVSGISYDSNKNYDVVKRTLKKLSGHSFWLPIDEDDVLCRWLSKVRTNRRNGIATIKLDKDLLPFLIDTKNIFFTEYQLLDILLATSKYSTRLYELLKSYFNLNILTFDVDELQSLMDSDYKNYADFERKVLKVAEKEINQYTALNVRHEIAERGRYNKVSKIKFYMYTKEKDIKNKINDKNHEFLDRSS